MNSKLELFLRKVMVVALAQMLVVAFPCLALGLHRLSVISIAAGALTVLVSVLIVLAIDVFSE